MYRTGNTRDRAENTEGGEKEPRDIGSDRGKGGGEGEGRERERQGRMIGTEVGWGGL